MRTQIKICGITRLDDAKLAIEAGADALGFVFYEKSQRFAEAAVAREIALEVGPFITTVGLFVDASEKQVKELLSWVPLQVLQFHGNESAEFCESFNRPYLKAVRVRNQQDIQAVFGAHPNAVGFLLDAYVDGVPGGTGEQFDWSLIPDALRSRVILAGGLTPANVGEAVTTISPQGVDVSGGVEQSPGIKSSEKIKAFCRAVVSASEGENTC